MQLGLLLKNYQISTESNIVNKRQSIIKQFVDEINQERPCSYKNAQGKKITLKPVTGKYIAIKLSHLTEFDLTYFLSECKDYKNRNGSFSKRFFGSLKNCG